MQTRPPPHKRTHLRHPKPDKATGKDEWLRRYWIALISIGLIAISAVTFNILSNDDEDQDTYVNVQTRTVAGDNNNVICKVSLLVDPEQEKGLLQRQPLLVAVVNSVLSEAYAGSRRPPPNEIRMQLLAALNNKLPRQLQIRDVLLQELIIGNS
ncbi:hypothetical protein AB6Q56_05735 [Dechloromonas sp. ARDL1]|uniref:hypothetical protein n=1 Tax=Dechloromonas sp. ARDL1 TaxID=3322121 RepID=UPI003DA71106